MTEQQYKKYTCIKNEIENLKSFLYFCGNIYKAEMVSKSDFSIKLFENIKDKFFLKGKYAWNDKTYELPKELQKRIVEVIEEYVKEREKEMENI